MEAAAITLALLGALVAWAWLASRRRDAPRMPPPSEDFLREPSAARAVAEAWARAADAGDVRFAVERARWHDGPTAYVDIRRRGGRFELRIDDVELDAAGPMPPPFVVEADRAALVDRLASLFLGGRPRPLGPRR